MAAGQLRFSPLFKPPNSTKFHHFPAKIRPFSIPLRSTNPNLPPSLASPDLPYPFDAQINDGNSGFGCGGGDNNSNNNNNWNSNNDHGNGREPSNPSTPLALLLTGWKSRVAADPEFPFKVLMEELVGLTATAAGDMASRPNFGLSELDFVFSTLVVGAIVNFILMYLLAPTSTVTASPSSLPSYIFEPGNFPLSSRIVTLFVKGATFAAVGFTAGLAGTGISNGLVALRGRVEDEEEMKAGPPTVLNAATWALHMGVSSNLRYQTLNAVEFAMAKGMPAAWFKAAVVVLRFLNNALGGMSFVALARMTGSQKVEEEKEKEKEV